MTGAIMQDGRKWLQCPHCHHIFEVDIDDILPVHGSEAVITGFAPFVMEYRGKPCDGSWNVKGHPLEIVITSEKAFKKHDRT